MLILLLAQSCNVALKFDKITTHVSYSNKYYTQQSFFGNIKRINRGRCLFVTLFNDIDDKI